MIVAKDSDVANAIARRKTKAAEHGAIRGEPAPMNKQHDFIAFQRRTELGCGEHIRMVRLLPKAEGEVVARAFHDGDLPPQVEGHAREVFVILEEIDLRQRMLAAQ